MEYRDPAPEFLPLDLNGTAVPEYTEAPPVGTTGQESKKEYEYETDRNDSPPRKKSGRTRSLLIQAAGVIGGGVLVLSSFNVDILGSNALLGGSSPSSGAVSSVLSPTPPSAYDIDPYPSVASKWPTKVTVRPTVTYLPTGETFAPETSQNEEAMKELKNWVASKGGDPDTLKLVKAKNIYHGLQKSDDAILVGDLDNPEGIFLGSGELWWDYEREEYYEASLSGSTPSALESGDFFFPTLSNRLPNGETTLYGVINEEYIFYDDGAGQQTYLHVGGVSGVSAGTVPGMSYDGAENTLTISGVSGGHLDINLMGNGFTLRVVGENRLDSITVWGFYYGGSMKVTGDGSLIVNEKRSNAIGLLLRAEVSETCLMVDRSVTLEVYGKENPADSPIDGGAAILILDTTMEKAIYYLTPNSLAEGRRSAIGEAVEAPYLLLANGTDFDPARTKTVRAYSVLGGDGMPLLHVRFSPKGN